MTKFHSGPNPRFSSRIRISRTPIPQSDMSICEKHEPASKSSNLDKVDFAKLSPAELLDRLQALCPYPLRLKIHDNRSTYAAARREKSGEIKISIHRLFLHASTPVLQALVQFALKSDKQSRSTIRQMAHLYFTRIEPPVPDPALADPQGDHVDLQIIFDRLNETVFEGVIQAPIAWTEGHRYRRFRHITYGSYDRTGPLIRINRLLDSPEVPLLFIEFIVYHEMLHAVCLPYLDSQGRMRFHTAEFRRREALHPHFAFAKEWEKESLNFFRKRQLQNSTAVKNRCF